MTTNVCELEIHAEGRFEVGNEKYRPIWPRGGPEVEEPQDSDSVARDMVNKGVKCLKEYYHLRRKHPSSVKVFRYDGTRTRVVIVD